MTESESKPQPQFSNQFGTIASERVTYFWKKGWFSGGTRKDVALKRVTSVSYETSRSIKAGILFLIIGIAALSSHDSKLAVLLFVPLAILAFWGSPAVAVNTSGNDHDRMIGKPWERADAHEFVETLRKRLFKD